VKAIEVKKGQPFSEAKTNVKLFNESQEDITFITPIIDAEIVESIDNDVRSLEVEPEKRSFQYNAQTYKRLLNETKSTENKGILQKETKRQYQVKGNLHDHELQWSETLTTHDSTALVLETENEVSGLEVEFKKCNVQYNAQTHKRLLDETKFEENKEILQKETE